MTNYHTASSLKAKLDSVLARAAGHSKYAATEALNKPGVIKSNENVEKSHEDVVNKETKSPRRDVFLDKLPASDQVEILKWADSQAIRADDPLWVLVDLIGYTKFMTDTLPSRMRAAGQQTVEAISKQRRAEADAFSDNAQKAMGSMLANLTVQVAQASENITETRLRKQLWRYGLLVASGISMLAALCFSFGYSFANAHFHWIGQYTDNMIMRMAQAILGLPIGYLIAPMVLTALVLMAVDAIAQWCRQRQ